MPFSAGSSGNSEELPDEMEHSLMAMRAKLVKGTVRTGPHRTVFGPRCRT